MDKIKKNINIPIFKYGLADNGYVFIPQELCTEDKLKSIPIFLESNGNNPVIIGMIYKIRGYLDGWVYGDVLLYYDSDEKFEFKNYMIQTIEYEIIDGIYFVKDFDVMDITFKVKD